MATKHYLQVFGVCVQREVRLAVRQPTAWLMPLLFFALVVLLFPLGVSPERATLQLIAPGVVWIAVLLANLLALERLFQQDFADGSLEQLLLSPYPLVIIVYGKLMAYWLLTNLPLIVVAPLFSMMFYLSWAQTQVMVLSLLLGTPIFTGLGAVGAALVMGVQQRGILLALILIPLYIPVLIFGTGSVFAVTAGLSVSGLMALLAAMLIIVLSCVPLAVVVALRIGVNE